MATLFHPELAQNLRFHQYFLNMSTERKIMFIYLGTWNHNTTIYHFIALEIEH